MFKKLCIIALSIVLFFMSFLQVLAQPSDIKGHWAEKQISDWVAKDLIGGYKDSSFKPGNTVTWAEFVTILNNALGYTQKAVVTYMDVSEKDWFYNSIAKAQAAGYLNGIKTDKFLPNRGVSRQEACAVISKALKLDISDKATNLAKYKDSNKINKALRAYVDAMVGKGYLGGYSDNTIRASQTITRAEAIVILNNAIGTLYNKAGTYGPVEGSEEISGNVTVNTKDIKLRNLKINGDLYLTEGIGDGDIELDHVVVTGKILVCGGIHNFVIRNSDLGLVNIDKKGGNIRVVATGNTSIDKIILNSGAKLEEQEVKGRGFDNVLVSVKVPESEKVDFVGDFKDIAVESSKIEISLTRGSIQKLDVVEKSRDVVINLNKDSSVNTLNINAPVVVKGEGEIENANVNVNGASIEKKPDNLNIQSGVVVTIGGLPVNGTTQSGSTLPGSGNPSGGNTGGSSGEGNGGDTGGNPGGGTTPTNHAPIARTIADKARALGSMPLVLPVNELATDEDGDTLTVNSVNASDTLVATVSIASNALVVTPAGEGSTTVTAEVYDNRDGVANISFHVNIINEPALEVTGATAIDASSVEVSFNEDVDWLTASNVQNFTVREKNGGQTLLPVTQITRQTDGSGNSIGNSVKITLGSAMSGNSEYEVIVTNITSVYGSLLNPGKISYTFTGTDLMPPEDQDNNMQLTAVTGFTVSGSDANAIAGWNPLSSGQISITGATGYEIYYIKLSELGSNNLAKDTPGAVKVAVSGALSSSVQINLSGNSGDYVFVLYSINGRTYSQSTVYCTLPSIQSVTATDYQTLNISFDKPVSDASIDGRIFNSSNNSLYAGALSASKDGGTTYKALDTYSTPFAYQDPMNSNVLIVRIGTKDVFSVIGLTSQDNKLRIQGRTGLVKSDNQSNVLLFNPSSLAPEKVRMGTVIGMNANTIKVTFNQAVNIKDASFARIGPSSSTAYAAAAILLSNPVACDNTKKTWYLTTSQDMAAQTYHLILNPNVTANELSDIAGIVTAYDENIPTPGIQEVRSFVGNPPEVAYVRGILATMFDRRTITVFFPEDMDPVTAGNISYYKITSDSGGMTPMSNQPVYTADYDIANRVTKLYLNHDIGTSITPLYLVVSSQIKNKLENKTVKADKSNLAGGIQSGMVIGFTPSSNAPDYAMAGTVTTDADLMGMTITTSKVVAFGPVSPSLAMDSDGILSINEFPSAVTTSVAGNFGVNEFNKVFTITGKLLGDSLVSNLSISSVERKPDGKTFHVGFDRPLEPQSGVTSYVTTTNNDNTLFMYCKTDTPADKSSNAYPARYNVQLKAISAVMYDGSTDTISSKVSAEVNDYIIITFNGNIDVGAVDTNPSIGSETGDFILYKNTSNFLASGTNYIASYVSPNKIKLTFISINANDAGNLKNLTVFVISGAIKDTADNQNYSLNLPVH
jgi:hypothetical protein